MNRTERARGWLEHEMRRGSARATQEILLRRGSTLEMSPGVGFPKSGTVWLCEMMSHYLGVPYPKMYRMPIAMQSVIHGHWNYDERFPRSAYIRRDGRDVTVSLYWHYVRIMETANSPQRVDPLRRKFHYLFGADYDVNDLRKNLPSFIEHEMASPGPTHGIAWHDHVLDWWDRPRVHHTTYEELRSDPHAAFSSLMSEFTGEEADANKVDLAVRRFDFSTVSGRKHGQEDRTSFVRKGATGDWKNHFSREAAEVFEQVTGGALLTLGYESTSTWYKDI